MSFYSSLLSSSSQSYDTDAQTYFTAVEAIEGTLPTALKSACNTFILTLKSNSLWTKVHFLRMSFAQTLAGSLVPIKSDSGLNITNAGSNLFLEYHYHPILGTIGRSTQTAVYNLKYKLTDSAAITLSNLSILLNKNWISINTSAYSLGVSDGTNQVSISTTNLLVGRINNKTLSGGTVNTGGINGFAALTADGSNARLIFNNSVQVTSAGVATGSIPNVEIASMGLNTSGTYSNINDCSGGNDFELIGEWYSQTDIEIIRQALLTLRTAQKSHYASVSNGLNLVMQYGQSLSVGAGGGVALSTTPSLINKKLNTPLQGATTGFTSIAAMVESSVETGIYSFAETITDSYPSHAIISTSAGQNGQNYQAIRKDGTYWGLSLHAQSNAIRELLYASGQALPRLRAVNFIHGESDDAAANASYAGQLAAIQSHFTNFINGGQDSFVPLILSQTSSWTKFTPRATPIAAPLQLKAVETAYTNYLSNPSILPLIVCACPKYFLPYIDGVHLTSAGYRWLMSFHARAYISMVINNTPWTGLRPNTVQRVSNVITIEFFVPVAPLVFNTSDVTDNTGGNKGFEFFVGTAGNSPVISSVVLGGNGTSVIITLDVAPTGINPEIRYSWTGISGNDAGPTTGARGNLCDSDSTSDRWGNSMKNWCVTFNKVV